MSRDWQAGMQRVVTGWLARKSHAVRSKEPLVSFCFDDFPLSAAHTGGRVLEDHGVRGTYYASLGRLEEGGRVALDTLRRLWRDGHELGCHTYSHLDCARSPLARVLEDLERNQKALSRAVPEATLINFAYPKGVTRPEVKRRLAARFASVRGLRPGVNRGRIDLAWLRANALYSRQECVPHACALLDDVARNGGWLIFYTHEVCDEPGPVGCRPEDLDTVVRTALALGCRVLPVRNALGAMAFRSKADAPAAESVAP